jgi:2-dehydro-3-deoxygluconokinase
VTDGDGGLVTLGETLGLLIAEDVGPLSLARGMRLSMGGAESNVAIGVARFGVPATWIGRLGDDPIGDLIERQLLAEWVRCLVHREKAGVLHLSGIPPALGAEPAETVRVAMRRARDAGVPVSFDLNYRSRLWDAATAAPVFRELAAGADILFAGDDEARIALGRDASVGPEALAEALAALGPSEVIVKLGRRGATARIDGEPIEVPAVAVHAVDTVGAGDAFVAGYLASRLLGRGVSDRLTTAVVTGAFAVTVPGDWEAFPRPHELSLLSAEDDVHR